MSNQYEVVSLMTTILLYQQQTCDDIGWYDSRRMWKNQLLCLLAESCTHLYKVLAPEKVGSDGFFRFGRVVILQTKLPPRGALKCWMEAVFVAAGSGHTPTKVIGSLGMQHKIFKLDLSGCMPVSESDINTLEGWTQLRALRLHGGGSMNNARLWKLLEALSALTELFIGSCPNLSEKDYNAVAKKYKNMKINRMLASDIVDEGLLSN